MIQKRATTIIAELAETVDAAPQHGVAGTRQAEPRRPYSDSAPDGITRVVSARSAVSALYVVRDAVLIQQTPY
jgi:hypothetical protein